MTEENFVFEKQSVVLKKRKPSHQKTSKRMASYWTIAVFL